MASATTLSLTPAHRGSFSTPPLSEESAKRTTELLQQNHTRFYMYFNESGFHNHLAHHMLALFAFNASPEVLQRHYNANTGYQVDMKPVDPAALKDLEEPAKFKQYLFKRDHYHDYLALFEREIEKLGWPAVLQKYLFAGDERAEDMLDRLWAGLVHPIIHVGYGVEWGQPAIIAEGLAQVATHDEYLGKLFRPAEERAAAAGHSQPRTLASLLTEASATPVLRDSTTMSDNLRVRDGVLARAQNEIVALAAQWTVGEDEIEAKLAELANTAGYVLAAAAEHPRYGVRPDFFLLHISNSMPLVAGLARCQELPARDRARVVERHGRVLLLTFVGQHCPDLYLDRVKAYQAKGKTEADKTWDGVTKRVMSVNDDSHMIKCVRGLRFAEQVSKPYEGKEGFPMASEDWLKAGNMIADLVEARSSDRFVFLSGFPESWVGQHEA